MQSTLQDEVAHGPKCCSRKTDLIDMKGECTKAANVCRNKHSAIPAYGSSYNTHARAAPAYTFLWFVAGRAANVKRCYSMRGTLALLDFEDPSIQGVQALMVRGAMLPAFLRCADGRKFIAHLFTLHVSFVHCA